MASIQVVRDVLELLRHQQAQHRQSPRGPGKGLHIEQSLPAREDHWEAIAALAASVSAVIAPPLPAEVALPR